MLARLAGVRWVSRSPSRIRSYSSPASMHGDDAGVVDLAGAEAPRRAHQHPDGLAGLGLGQQAPLDLVHEFFHVAQGTRPQVG
jgi:hypothetical protein